MNMTQGNIRIRMHIHIYIYDCIEEKKYKEELIHKPTN